MKKAAERPGVVARRAQGSPGAGPKPKARGWSRDKPLGPRARSVMVELSGDERAAYDRVVGHRDPRQTIADVVRGLILAADKARTVVRRRGPAPPVGPGPRPPCLVVELSDDERAALERVRDRARDRCGRRATIAGVMRELILAADRAGG